MKPIPYGRQSINEEDIACVVEILRGDWLTQGPNIGTFEQKIADYCGAVHAVVFNSGTSAWHGAVFAAGIGVGDEVITCPMSFAATSNGVLYCGAEPVFVDMDPATNCMDLQAVEAAITSRTRAIAPIDYAGYPVDLRTVREIAHRHNLLVMEDAAHALGAERGSQMIGSEADMTMFSFHPVKHITTGEGGVIVTNNAEYAERLRLFRSHGITREAETLLENHGPWYYEMQELGYNYRITDLQCALGSSQLKRLPAFLERRRQIAVRYDQALAGAAGLTTPPVPNNGIHAYHLYPIRVFAPDNESASAGFEQKNAYRRDFYDYLRAAGIMAQVHYVPIHLHPFYRKRYGYKPGDYPAAETFYAEEISLPMYPELTEEQQNYVIEKVLTYSRKTK